MMETHAVLGRLRDSKTPDLLTHPDQVIVDSELSEFEKRAILANWASDARAVEGAPALRRLDNGAFVRIDNVLNSLRRLDNAVGHMSSLTRPPLARRRKAPIGVGTRTFDPDDKPPPCAASAPIPARPIYTIAKAVPLSEAA
jgi:hypothetical protein